MIKNDRERKLHKRRYGMKVSGKSVKLLATLTDRVPQAVKKGKHGK